MATTTARRKTSTTSTTTPKSATKSPRRTRKTTTNGQAKDAIAKAAAATPRVGQDQIARRAYEIWLERGQPAGCDEENWLTAEAELCSSRN